jgi:hypothetical protein
MKKVMSEYYEQLYTNFNILEETEQVLEINDIKNNTKRNRKVFTKAPYTEFIKNFLKRKPQMTLLVNFTIHSRKSNMLTQTQMI